MTLSDTIEVAIELMDRVALNGNDSRVRGMAQIELRQSLVTIENLQNDVKKLTEALKKKKARRRVRS